MKVPYSWLTSYCDPGLSAEEIGSTLSMHSIELERISHLGAPSDEGFVVGRVLSAEPHPDADRLRVCEVDTGDGTRTIVCGAPNVAAGQTVAVVTPGARMPGGSELRKAKLRGVESDGMILSETGARDRRRRGRDPGPLRSTPAARLSASRPGAAGSAEGLVRARRWLRCSRSPSRCSSSSRPRTGSTASASTGSRGSCTRSPAPSSRRRLGTATPRRPGTVRSTDYASVTVEVPGALPALQRPGLHRRPDRTLAAVAEGAPDRGRDAADQQRRRHHQLRDADDRAAAARLRPRQGARGRDHRPHGARGRDDDHARRQRAPLRRRRGAGLRPRRSHRRRRDHGRPGLRGQRLDHPGAARGRDLGRGQRPAHLAQARAALRRLEPKREAAAPGARPARPADRLAAAGRALRRAAGAGDDRRGGRDPAGAAGATARRPRRSGCSGSQSRATISSPT